MSRYQVVDVPRQYGETRPPTVRPLAIAIPDWLIAFLLGAFILGPFIWTPVGRFLATSAIAKGAKVSKEKVESWLEAG